ncbi:hypothetical protein [Paenibacillus sp. TC-CSREp1]
MIHLSFKFDLGIGLHSSTTYRFPGLMPTLLMHYKHEGLDLTL